MNDERADSVKLHLEEKRQLEEICSDHTLFVARKMLLDSQILELQNLIKQKQEELYVLSLSHWYHYHMKTAATALTCFISL